MLALYHLDPLGWSCQHRPIAHSCYNRTCIYPPCCGQILFSLSLLPSAGTRHALPVFDHIGYVLFVVHSPCSLPLLAVPPWRFPYTAFSPLCPVGTP